MFDDRILPPTGILPYAQGMNLTTDSSQATGILSYVRDLNPAVGPYLATGDIFYTTPDPYLMGTSIWPFVNREEAGSGPFSFDKTDS